MKILHFSDTHLGFQAFDRVNAEGINTREQDVYDAFARVVTHILESRPDVVVHSGDFFHRPSPSNRALTFGLEQLRRIRDARIPIVIIAGNHETPKTVYNSPILRALRSIDGVFPIFGEQWEQVRFDGLAVHGVPHINDPRLLHRELERMEPVANAFNILLLHTSLGKGFLMDEYGEQVFPAEFEQKLAAFQYIALGHWHNFQKTGSHPNAWYAGSTERLSDTEIGADKGFITLGITPEKTLGSLDFQSIPTRSWIRWEMARCFELSVAEIEASLEKFIAENAVDQAIVSLVFDDIRPEQTLELGNLRLRQLFSDAFQVIPRRKTWSERDFVRGIEVGQFDRLDHIFADYLRSKYPDDEALAERLVERAKGYFASETQG